MFCRHYNQIARDEQDNLFEVIVLKVYKDSYTTGNYSLICMVLLRSTFWSTFINCTAV